jgi:hypothetical protein
LLSDRNSIASRVGGNMPDEMAAGESRRSKEQYLRVAIELVRKKGGVMVSKEYVSAKTKLRVQ